MDQATITQDSSDVDVVTEPASDGAPPPRPPGESGTGDDPDSGGGAIRATSAELGFWGGAFAALFWIAVGFAVALGNSTSRAWLYDHWIWVVLIGTACAVVTVVALIRGWVGRLSTPKRAALFLLVGLPAVAFGAASIFFWMPTSGQLITIRAVVLVVLVVTPALMWWLFLATQRASLLNEFLANLHRLGLLEALHPGDQTESRVARNTRVSSYLQRFEATYGRLPQRIHREVLTNTFKPYTTNQARDQAPLATAAVPVTLAVVVLAVGWLIALPPVNEFPIEDTTTSPRWLLALSPNPTPATFAFLGAYFFSMQMLFRRYVRADLRGSAYIAVVLRIVLAVIGAWVITAVGAEAGWTEESQLLLLAFVIGVFPMVVWQLTRALASQLFKLTLPNLRSRLPLERLDGLTVWHEARLEEEDIENVPNMATADIVDMLVNTPFPATRIIDWVDQAILLIHLGPDEADNAVATSARRQLARHGIRTASGLLKAAADRTANDSRESFDSILVDTEGRPAIPSLISALQTSANLYRVLRWRGMQSLSQVLAPPTP